MKISRGIKSQSWTKRKLECFRKFFDEFLWKLSIFFDEKNIDEINEDFCPDGDDRFFQFPIGGDRPIEEIRPLVELNESVNLTSIEIESNGNDSIVVFGDDRGTIYKVKKKIFSDERLKKILFFQFRSSSSEKVEREEISSDFIVDLKIIRKNSSIGSNEILILTKKQIFKRNLTNCSQFDNCQSCEGATLCRWSSKEKR